MQLAFAHAHQKAMPLGRFRRLSSTIGNRSDKVAARQQAGFILVTGTPMIEQGQAKVAPKGKASCSSLEDA